MKLGVHRRRCVAFSACCATMSSTLLPMFNRSASHPHHFAFVALAITEATFFVLALNELRLAKESGEVGSAACGGRFSWLRKG